MDDQIDISCESGLQGLLEVGEEVVTSPTPIDSGALGKVEPEMGVGQEKNSEGSMCHVCDGRCLRSQCSYDRSGLPSLQRFLEMPRDQSTTGGVGVARPARLATGVSPSQVGRGIRRLCRRPAAARTPPRVGRDVQPPRSVVLRQSREIDPPRNVPLLTTEAGF